MRQGKGLSFAGLLLLSACAGPVHQVPKPSQAQIAAAETAMLAERDVVARQTMTFGEAAQVLAAAVGRVHPAGQQVCHEVRVGNCDWRYRLSASRTLNAAATVDGYVILNRGLAELTANEDERAFVIAHELGHHVADHPVTGNTNAYVGGLVGGMLGAALDVAAGRYVGYMDLGKSLGQHAGWLSYSKEQEREADYLGIVIAYRAGIDLDKARGIMLTMTRMSGKRESGAFDTHPMGAERLAAFDQAVAAVRASNGALPPRAK